VNEYSVLAALASMAASGVLTEERIKVVFLAYSF